MSVAHGIGPPTISSTSRALVAGVLALLGLALAKLRAPEPPPALALLPAPPLALALALLLEPRRPASGSPVWSGIALVAALASAVASAVVVGLADAPGRGLDAPLHGLAPAGRAVVALAVALLTLPAPAVVLAARQASLRLELQVAAGALGLATPSVTLLGPGAPAWLALVTGAAVGCGLWLVDARERDEARLRDVAERPRAALGGGLALALVALVGLRLVALATGAGVVGPEVEAVRARLEAVGEAIARHAERHGAPPAALVELDGVDPDVARGVAPGYVIRYARQDGWWGLAADPARASLGWPALRKVGRGPVEAAPRPLPLAPDG